MKKIKNIIVFSTLFVLVDLLLVCGAVLGIMLYDYFSHRELFKMYLSEYGLPLILFLLFTLSTIICAVLFRVGYLVRTKKATMKAWLKTNSKVYDDEIPFVEAARKQMDMDMEMFHLSSSILYTLKYTI